MSSYFYKSTDVSILAAVAAWDEKLAAFHAKREKMTDVFGGPGSPMHSGGDKYVGGVKISTSQDLDVHWRRPDEYGYRSLRSAAKPAKGTSKEDRAALREAHAKLLDLWQQHCPARISMDDAWKAMNIDWGNIWLSGGVFFQHEGVVYLHLGFQVSEGSDNVKGATEIVASEFESARQQMLDQRKKAA